MLTKAEIEEVIGPVDVSQAFVTGAHPSPGMHQRHYSPRTQLVLVNDGRLPSAGRGAYLWINKSANAACMIQMPNHPRAYAALLYEKLHQADAQGWDWIAVEKPPLAPEWAAIHDRLERAAAK
jgi:L-threonylcarbamoyladenylate synthase